MRNPIRQLQFKINCRKKTSSLLLSMLMLFFSISLDAQMKVGDNPTTLNSNSILEIESTNKGVLLPRLSLSSTTVPSPLSTHLAGMVAYNVATAADVTPGFYYNDGSKWVRLYSSSTAANSTAATNLITITNGTGATLTAMTVGVDTAALKTFLNNKITVTASAPLTGNGTTTSPLGITQNNTSGGQLITVTNGTGASFTAMTVGVDTAALKTFVSGKTAVSVSAPITGDGTVANPIGVTRATATNGILTTVTNGANAAFTALKYDVDTAALKTFLNNKVTVTASAPITGDGTAANPISVTRATATNGVLTTVTNGTNAAFTALKYDVDTVALKTFINGRTTNTLTAASNAITNTINGVAATLTPALGTIASGFTLGFDATGNLVRGLGAAPDSTTASNGLTLTGKDVRLGGVLTASTTITTSATNTLAIAGLQSGKTTDSILVINPTTNVISRISAGKFKNGNLLVTTATSLTINDTLDVVIYRGTASSTMTLPSAAANIGKVLRILNYAVSATNVDVTLSPAPIIQGAATDFSHAVLSSQLKLYGSNAGSGLGNTIEIVSDGVNWFKLGN